MSNYKGKYYLSTLDDSSRDLCMKKLQLADNSQLPNPYDLLGCKNEVFLLPDISWPDIYNYLINPPGPVCTNESLKSCKSLNAYNYFVSGHVQEVYYHEIENNCKFYFIKSEVDTFCGWVTYIPLSFLANLIGKQRLLKFLKNILRKLC